MTITPKLSEQWESELKEYGVMYCCEQMGLNYRKVLRAIKTKTCTLETFNTINGFLLSQRERTKKVIKVLTEDQN